MIIPKRTFLVNKFTTTGMVEHEEKGGTKANTRAATTPKMYFFQIDIY